MISLNRFLNLFRRSRMEENLDLEVRSHLEMETEENLRRGMPPTQAERTARIRLGGVAQVKEMYRDQWGIPALESLFKDLVFAVRSLRRDPGFTIVAVVALTLGVAFTLSIFTVVNGVLINPLDFPDPDRIMVFLFNQPWGESQFVSSSRFDDWRNQQQSFVDLAAYHYTEFNLSGAKNALRLNGFRVSPGFFTVLGVKPLLGRAFPSDATATSQLAVLSYATWERGFSRNPAALGQTISLNDQPYQICAVLPAGKPAFPESDVFVLFDPSTNREIYSVIGRIRPGVTLKAAQADIDLVSRRLPPAYRRVWKDFRVRLQPLVHYLVGDTRPRLLAIMGAVFFVLLIACLNIASLLLTRGSLRAREVAVRNAIGATRFRVIRQFLIESLVLALAGSSLGLVLASLSVRFLQTSFPYSVPRLKEASLDSHVVAFAVIVGVLSALVFGLVPALRGSRINLGTVLKEGATSTTHTAGSLRMRSAMVVIQVALSAVLVIGAGLLIKSYWLLTGVKLGFRTEGVIMAHTVLSSARYKTPADKIQFVTQAEDLLKGLPGVEKVGAANNLTFSNWSIVMSGFQYETRNGERREASGRASYKVIRPEFFEALGISCLQGRMFDARDNAHGAPVLILDRSLAAQMFQDGEALNRRVFLNDQWRTVVGVVNSVRENGPVNEPRATLYIPFDQEPGEQVGWAIKTAVPPAAIFPEIRRVLGELDHEQPIYSVQTMRDAFSESVMADRLNTALMFAFAAAALALAAVGLYGVLAYQVASRTREIGIRIAVGAQRAQVFRDVAVGGLKLVAGGLCLGLLAAAGLTRVLSGMLYSVRPLDWSVFVIVAGLLLAVGFLALAVPAWTASRLSPSQALRWE